MYVQGLHYSCCVSEGYCEGGNDKRIPLLRDVFEAFPSTPVNVDIKVNDDTLIKKVNGPMLSRSYFISPNPLSVHLLVTTKTNQVGETSSPEAK